MSTTDIKAAFEAWAELTTAQREGTLHDAIGWYYFDDLTNDRWEAWQAATEAAKATSVAVRELPELPKVGPICYAMRADCEEYRIPRVGKHLVGVYDEALWSSDQMRAYGQQCAEAAKLNMRMAMREATECAAEWKAKAEAARQPAPVVAVTRIDTGYGNYLEFERKTTGKSGWLVRTESGDLVRALNPTEVLLVDSALAATAAPVLSDEQILELAAHIFNFKPHKQTPETKAEFIAFARAILAARSQP